ncbi:hypothetical protein A2363_01845 [Candidatus Gottesmanbacteria bacterium RIFOXYB1_FULL_47_11]|uniref:Polymerase nucleotidyl transferase domain-containing protein n=1 Tax=Candidatus Gottesmanbacteria bacterium RIFOXYB1_FULL_47_11 TaxID=1798401 RepID=A0A1F6BDC0_9BACT|nr:MAG: hypothetical protein A2363_01845 [Candidatus Gottesmanbacteria bacterium RIFOXYB1_FULL_47_11]
MSFPEKSISQIDEDTLNKYREVAGIIVLALPHEVQCNQVVLYGSRASGFADANSDVDILVLLDGVPDSHANIPFDQDEFRAITDKLEQAGVPLGKRRGKYDVIFKGLQYLDSLDSVYLEHLKTCGVRLWPLKIH